MYGKKSFSLPLTDCMYNDSFIIRFVSEHPIATQNKITFLQRLSLRNNEIQRDSAVFGFLEQSLFTERLEV